MSLGTCRVKYFCELGKCGILRGVQMDWRKTVLYLFGLIKISAVGQLSELIQFSANNRSASWCSGAVLYQAGILLMHLESRGLGGSSFQSSQPVFSITSSEMQSSRMCVFPSALTDIICSTRRIK